MDRTGIIVVTICVILLFLTWPEMPQRPQQPQPVTTSTNAVGTNVVQQPAAAPLPSTPGIKPSVELESENWSRSRLRIQYTHSPRLAD